jgi:hypothetical protein
MAIVLCINVLPEYRVYRIINSSSKSSFMDRFKGCRGAAHDINTSVTVETTNSHNLLGVQSRVRKASSWPNAISNGQAEGCLSLPQFRISRRNVLREQLLPGNQT